MSFTCAIHNARMYFFVLLFLNWSLDTVHTWSGQPGQPLARRRVDALWSSSPPMTEALLLGRAMALARELLGEPQPATTPDPDTLEGGGTKEQQVAARLASGTRQAQRQRQEQQLLRSTARHLPYRWLGRVLPRRRRGGTIGITQDVSPPRGGDRCFINRGTC